jgi:hypothetical protein
MAATTTKPKADSREKRALIDVPEIRMSGEGEERTAEGYAVLWDNEANINDMWVESLTATAFDTSLATRDVIALHSHDFARIVGRKSSGTLTLRSDAKGLYFENQLPDTSDGRDLGKQIDRGDIAGMSFGFRAVKQEWDNGVDPPKRTITEAELYEITYTAVPAYDDTEVGMRSLEKARAELREHNKNGAAARLRLRLRKTRAENE